MINFDSELKELSHEVIGRSIDIVDLCHRRVDQIDPTYAPEWIPLRIRYALGLRDVQQKPKDKWREASQRLERLLMEAGVMRSPQIAQAKIVEYLQKVPPFEGYDAARRYLRDTRQRLLFLETPENRDRLGGAKLGGYSFVEGFVLRRAIQDGVYYTRAS